MFSNPTTWLIICMVFGVALLVLVAWIFSNVELEMSETEHLDPSIRKRFGRTVLLSAGIAVFGVLVILLNLQSARYWVGVFSFVLAILILHTHVSPAAEKSGGSQVEPIRDGEFDKISSSYKFRRIVILTTKAFTVIFLYSFFGGSAYVSLFDLSGFIFLLISSDLNSFKQGARSH